MVQYSVDFPFRPLEVIFIFLNFTPVFLSEPYPRLLISTVVYSTYALASILGITVYFHGSQFIRGNNEILHHVKHFCYTVQLGIHNATLQPLHDITLEMWT